MHPLFALVTSYFSHWRFHPFLERPSVALFSFLFSPFLFFNAWFCIQHLAPPVGRGVDINRRILPDFGFSSFSCFSPYSTTQRFLMFTFLFIFRYILPFFSPSLHSHGILYRFGGWYILSFATGVVWYPPFLSSFYLLLFSVLVEGIYIPSTYNQIHRHIPWVGSFECLRCLFSFYLPPLLCQTPLYNNLDRMPIEYKAASTCRRKRLCSLTAFLMLLHWEDAVCPWIILSQVIWFTGVSKSVSNPVLRKT